MERKLIFLGQLEQVYDRASNHDFDLRLFYLSPNLLIKLRFFVTVSRAAKKNIAKSRSTETQNKNYMDRQDSGNIWKGMHKWAVFT